MIERISEIEGEAVIGETYLVPCLPSAEGEWWPVIGGPHDDRDIIGVEDEHWHRDLRFFTDEQLERTLRRNYGSERPIEYALNYVLPVEHFPKHTVERELVCQRPMPEYPLHSFFSPTSLVFLPALEAAYRDSKLTDCRRCPHRGLPLAGMPVRNNKVVCPGHSLSWDVTTGAMVSRIDNQQTDPKGRTLNDN